MSESVQFKPIPYSFTLVNTTNEKPLIIMNKKNISATCPPFYILLDHTIAVIWKLFSLNDKDPIPLGCGQISWALRFLEGMATTNDSRDDICSVDTKKAIECLQSAFVNCISQDPRCIGEEKNEYGTEIKRIEENDNLINDETSDSSQERYSFKSIILKDMLKK